MYCENMNKTTVIMLNKAKHYGKEKLNIKKVIIIFKEYKNG